MFPAELTGQPLEELGPDVYIGSLLMVAEALDSEYGMAPALKKKFSEIGVIQTVKPAIFPTRTQIKRVGSLGGKHVS